ncbi:hypothetical protein [Pectobacterium punjabense]|uniref:hypothetical protein n=1 Tax=Pectobacterium punjabense TaxID=2108399 RepID=UPI001968D0D7|nr:hypothetical protein [Pectobacterium punjabense]MBN3137473.1 hypothetical protein [Pectobacterium punjabense]MCE5380487.1 hypothetical protein [Pectobacterium punjabense]
MPKAYTLPIPILFLAIDYRQTNPVRRLAAIRWLHRCRFNGSSLSFFGTGFIH